MSSPIELRLSPSLTAGLLSITPWLVLATFTTVAAIETSAWLLALLPLIAALTRHQFVRCGLLRGRGAIVALQATPEGLVCELADGRQVSARVCSSSGLGASLLALKLRPEGSTSGSMFTLIVGDTGLFRANVAEDDFRRLRMWLRTGPAATTH